MKIKLYYQNQINKKKINYINFKRILKTVIKELCDNGIYEVSLTIIDDEYIHELNKTYRNIDRPTDVLSFAFNESDTISDPSIPVLLGDIFISLETAIVQAKSYNHSLKRELSFLFCHGLLHLLGYDHMKTEDEKTMFGLQDKFLNKLNIRR